MAKTFDNISEASATNYHFLFAQRTLALQDEPPTPPPLNALGLPYHMIRAMLELRKYWVRNRGTAKRHQILPVYRKVIGGVMAAAAAKAAAEEEAAEEKAKAKAVAEVGLRKAAEKGDLKTLTRLMEEGADPEAESRVSAAPPPQPPPP